MRISVVTVCRNAELEIENTMRSVLNQKYSDYEYVVIDGASTDSTNDIIQRVLPEFEEKGIPVTYLSEKDEGISDAFNKGVKHAKGDFVVLVNAGDKLTNLALSTVSGQCTDDVDIIYGNMLWIDKDNGLEYIRKSKEKPDSIVYEMCIMHPATYIKKAAYEKYGYYKKEFRYSMDRDLLARMYTKGAQFKYINATLSVMKAGGVSDAVGNVPRKKEESKLVAKENGVSSLRFNYIYYKAQVMNRLKLFTKKHMGKLYQNIKKKL